ncbi:MAG: hypothetical protein AAFQ80_19920 [Cyanobacteria bacterium J06621_8]
MSNFETRFRQIFYQICAEDYSTALTLICPLIDRAGKEIYGIKKTGVRFKKVIYDNNDFIYWMMSGGVLIMDKDAKFIFNREGKENIDLAQSIYKFVRSNLLHEAELSDQIKFTKEITFGPNGNKLIFPINLIWALVFMLSYLDCYKGDFPKKDYQLSICGVQVPLCEIWGNKEKVIEFFYNYIY